MVKEKYEKAKIECKINMWIMIIGASIIFLNFAFGWFLGHQFFSGFVFVSCIYMFIGLFIYLIYDPIGRFKHWKKNRNQ